MLDVLLALMTAAGGPPGEWARAAGSPSAAVICADPPAHVLRMARAEVAWSAPPASVRAALAARARHIVDRLPALSPVRLRILHCSWLE